jgi:hypothetical protein
MQKAVQQGAGQNRPSRPDGDSFRKALFAYHLDLVSGATKNPGGMPGSFSGRACGWDSKGERLIPPERVKPVLVILVAASFG